MNVVNLNSGGQPFTSTTWTFVARLMKPVIRVFLRMGFSAEQISQMVRKLAVDVAMEYPEFRPAHRKRAYLAHAAVVTGLSRKEVAKLNDVDHLADATDTPQVNRSIRVLSGWRNDQRYRDPGTNKPLTKLPFKAAKGVSFHQLVREYGGDVPPRSVLDALIQSGALRRSGNSVELQCVYPMEAVGKEGEMDFIGILLGDALSTAEYDLRPDTKEKRLFREWFQPLVPEDRAAEAQAIVREETMAFGRTLDERLDALSHRTPKANTRYKRLGLGAFYFERSVNPEE